MSIDFDCDIIEDTEQVVETKHINFAKKSIAMPETIDDTEQTNAVDLNKTIETNSELLTTYCDKQNSFHINSDCIIIEDTENQAITSKTLKEDSLTCVDFIEDTELTEYNKENIPKVQNVDVIPDTELNSSKEKFALTPAITQSKLSLKRINKNTFRILMNPLEEAATSKFCPLTVLQRKTSSQKERTPTKHLSPKSSSVVTVASSNLRDTKPVVASTRLHKHEVVAILILASRKNLIKYCEVFSPDVTHLVVDVDENNCLKDITIKFLLAAARGIWVVNFKWIAEMLKLNYVVDAEKFEACDAFGTNGPRSSRLRTDYLFDGFKFCVNPPFSAGTVDEFQVRSCFVR